MAVGQGTYLFRLLPGKRLSRNFADLVPTESMSRPPPPPIPVMKACLTTLGRHSSVGIGGDTAFVRCGRLACC